MVVSIGPLRIVRNYERVARFRLGNYEGLKGPGIVIVIPIFHSTETVDTRLIVKEIPDMKRRYDPRSSGTAPTGTMTLITKDNVTINVNGLVYYRVDVDNAEKSVLEVEDHEEAVEGLATTTMRAVMGDMALDEVLSERERMNEQIRERLDVETERWGIKVTNVEVQEINMDPAIREGMERQMTAERERRAAILEAEGSKQSQILEAEGQRQSAILRAEGQRQSEILKAEGQAQALQNVQDVAQGVGVNAMTLEYIEALKELGKGESTKFVIPVELTKLLGGISGIGGGKE